MKIFRYLAVLSLTFSLVAAEQNSAPKISAADAKTEKNITRITAQLLEHLHYAQKPVDDDISELWFNRYIDNLDGLRLHFLQSDVAEFEKYRTQLDDLAGEGDTRPAHLIFQRMLERVDQRVAYVNKLLESEKFEFTGSDRYTPDRRKLPRAKTIEEARHIWRQHLRSEFLQDKLALSETNKTDDAKNKKTSPKESSEENKTGEKNPDGKIEEGKNG